MTSGFGQTRMINDASSSGRVRIALSVRLSLAESSNLRLSTGTSLASRACRLPSTKPRPIEHFGAQPGRQQRDVDTGYG